MVKYIFIFWFIYLQTHAFLSHVPVPHSSLDAHLFPSTHAQPQTHAFLSHVPVPHSLLFAHLLPSIHAHQFPPHQFPLGAGSSTMYPGVRLGAGVSGTQCEFVVAVPPAHTLPPGPVLQSSSGRYPTYTLI